MRDGPLAGVGLMVLAMVLLPSGDSIAKYLGTVTPYRPEFLAWSRFAIASCLLLPTALLLRSFTGLGRRFYLQQAVRGALTAAAISGIIHALQTTPLADAFGVFFVGPSFATLLAALLLRERVTWLGWAAVLLGFAGVLLVVRPSPQMNLGILWALFGGACYGGMLVSTRWAAGSGPPFAQVTAQFVFGCVFLLPVGVGQLASHGVMEPGWLVLMCGCSLGANLLSIMALGRAPANYLAPVVYLQLVAASVLSVTVFGDSLDTIALLGLAVIITAGMSRVPWTQRYRRWL